MTSQERVMNLFESANPVPERGSVAPPKDASGYLSTIQRESSTMTLTASEPETSDNNNQKRPWILVAAAVAALALIGGLIYAGNVDDEQVPADQPVQTVPAAPVVPNEADDSADDSDPEAALNTYAAAINAHSIDDTMAAFAEDSRMIDHPLNPVELNGKEEIRRVVSQTVNLSREDPDPYAISNVVAEGNTVSWSYVWVNSSDLEYCSDGNEIDVNSDGLIVEFRWPEDAGEDCDE
jgi:ketosteroid isomerase-like protein